MTREQDVLHARLEEFLQRVFSFCQTDAMEALVELDVSFTQARTLFVLAHTGTLPITEIATRLHVSVASAGRNVDQLVRLGVLERQEDPSDRRVKLVGLTKRGLEVVDEQFQQKREALRVFTDRLPASEAEELTSVLGTILAGDYWRTSTKEAV